jgi:hypothetical protein
MGLEARWKALLGVSSFFIATVAASGPLPAETLVTGTISTSTWSEAGSPYHVTGTVLVPTNDTLSIDPGVAVSFDAGTSLVCRGTLAIAGTAEKNVVFGPHTVGGEWGGVLLTGGTARGQIDYLELHDADVPSFDGTNHPGAFTITRGAKVALRHIWFHHFDGVVVDSNQGSELILQDSLIEHSHEAVHSANGYALVERCTIRHVTGYSDCIDYDNESTPQSAIRECLIEDNAEDDGIDLGGASALVENVTIRSIRAGKAVSIDMVCSPVIRNVVVHDCMWGFVIKDKSTPLLDHCTATQNEVGVKCYQKIAGAGGGHGTAHSMILWGNDENIAVDALSTFALTYSIAGGGYAGAGNLDADPLFADPAIDDFHIPRASPAAGSGKDASDMGAFPAEGGVVFAPFVRGEVNADEDLNIGDPVSILFYLFSDSLTPVCLDSADADDSGAIDITDAVYLLGFLFTGGPEPPAPFPLPGLDPTASDPYECID